MTARTVAVYDANVLYPAPLRDLLVRMARACAVRAHWSDAIHDEWTRNLLANRADLTPAQLARTRRLMDAAVPGACVLGHEHLIPTLSLPDPDDHHVLAAAIHAGAEVIVTFNLADFPDAALATHGVRAEHPDRFVARLLDVAEGPAWAAVRQHHDALRNPPMTWDAYLANLSRVGLVKSTAIMARMREDDVALGDQAAPPSRVWSAMAVSWSAVRR